MTKWKMKLVTFSVKNRAKQIVAIRGQSNGFNTRLFDAVHLFAKGDTYFECLAAMPEAKAFAEDFVEQFNRGDDVEEEENP